MAWFKVDDTLHGHPKVRRAGAAAAGAVVRRIVPNMGMVGEVKTLATAGTVPGRDRTVEEFDMPKHTPRPTANRTIVRKLAGAWFTACPCGYLWRSTHHRLALLFAVEHKCGRRA